jgi:putative SOS response-associated peptidase YedK
MNNAERSFTAPLAKSPDTRYTVRIMCGRYTLSTPMEALEQRFHATLPRQALTPTYNAAPSQTLPVICNTHSQEITLSAWGFVPEWADGRAGVKPLINARAETIATKPTFRQAFRSKRCLVLTDGFYEWKRAGKSKVPHWIALKSREPFAFAGIWSTVHDPSGHPYTTFAILTTEANELMAQIHNRMPVILHARDEATWLNQRCTPDEAQALLVPFPAELLTLYEVSSKVNSPTYNTPDALHPVTHVQTPTGDR